MALPNFVSVPARADKPRDRGLTHVLDTGLTAAATSDVLAGGAAYIDIWKTGWGIAYVDAGVADKLAVLRRHDVATCLGGTLLEIAWSQGTHDACLDWAAEVGFTHVEVSRGTLPMSPDAKRDLVRRAAGRFTVLTEVGTKDADDLPDPGAWRDEAVADRDAGAALVVAEGRQSGTVGIYDSHGRPRDAVVEALVEGVGTAHVVFEAPRTAQQAWFVRRFGPDVNLGNVAVGDVLGVETLRLGLRSDTAARPVYSGPRGAAVSSSVAAPDGPNVVPGRYRGVSVARVDRGLDEASLREHFLGREAYWKTRFVVVLPGDGRAAVVAVARDDPDALFAPITAVRLLAGPDECALVHDPACDTAIPSDLARTAEEYAPGVRAVVVQGRYEHVNFILDPRPLRITVREVVPPRPAKLLDQASRLIAVTESWPPIRLVPEIVDLAELAREHPAEHYLLPCRGGGAEIPTARLSYLDEHPEPADWTQLGCERSRQIHRAFYGSDVERVDLCPRTAPADGPLLTKCCLQQEELAHGVDGGAPWAAVPWGSSLDVVREALDVIVRESEPSWSPV